MSVEEDVVRRRADLIATDALGRARGRLRALTTIQHDAVEELVRAVADGVAGMSVAEAPRQREDWAEMRLVFVGLTHRSAPVEVRERVHFSPEAGALLARRLAGSDGEAVALATCNRTELYLAHEDASAAVARAGAELRRGCRLPEVELRRSLAVLEDEAAARHLFRVAAGLDSMAPGEAQVLGQVRRAYDAARAAGGTGPLLDRAFRQALHAGKRVRKETGIGELGVSLASAAVDLSARACGGLGGCRVLVLGTGNTARLAALDLIRRGAGPIAVVNRTPERARDLADRLGVEALPLGRLAEELARADVVVAATSSPTFVVSAGLVRSTIRRRGGRGLLFVDLGVPRNVDPGVAAVPGCRLLGIDDVAAVLRETLAGKHDELARAELLVAEEARRFSAWRRSRQAVPAITSLRRRGEQLRLAELERVRKTLAGLSARDRRIVDALTARIVGRLLHAPTVSLRDATAFRAATSESPSLSASAFAEGLAASS